MAKRRNSVSFKIEDEDAPKKQRDPNRQRHEDVDSGLDFEDPFEDEYEEESYEDNGDDEEDNGDEEENDDGADIEAEEVRFNGLWFICFKFCSSSRWVFFLLWHVSLLTLRCGCRI
jgi:hypothetical protein